ncbi:MAG TPA: PQQ-dependent sugar dehydrogenase [Terriglobales bacterium]|nr:PQQ-dependent sugar dehydrogenase [Terriglobales bacterium]
MRRPWFARHHVLLAFVVPVLVLAQADFAGAGKTRFALAQLKAPPGFHISAFAEHVDGARMVIFSPGGVLLVSESGVGKVVALPDPNHTGKAARTETVLDGLNEPHGLAFYAGKLYVAENDKVRRYDWDEANLRASNPFKVTDLPTGGGHSTRSLLFHGGKMYVSAGSSCNACVEKDQRRAAVMEFNPDGSGQKIFAKGLRNAVGLAVNPKTDTIWATVNGRDWMGDDLPPETIYDLGKDGGDAGWPYCYGDRLPDSNFTKPGTEEDRCQNVIRPKVQMQAHSAPLGLAFYEGTSFPAEYRNNIFVAFHGSWNRSIPTGYKVVRVKLDDKGQPVSGAEDFITGWLAPGEKQRGRWMGRPVGIVFGADGAMYLSDDAGGVIYRITYGK